MKKVIILAASVVLLASCTGRKTSTEEVEINTDSTTVVAEEPTDTKGYDLEAIAKVIEGAETVMGFREGRASVVKDGKLGVIDKKGNIIIPFEYGYSVYKYTEGILCCHKEDTRYYFDHDGKLLFTSEYGGSCQFHDGLACIYKDGKYTYIDKTGKLAFDEEWEWAEDFSDGMALVMGDNGWGFIDTTGKLVIPYQYDSPSERNPEGFHEGLAAVIIDPTRELFGYIDKTGKQVFPKLYPFDSQFSEGLANVYDREIERYVYIDKTGKTVITLDEGDTGSDFSEGLSFIHKNGTSYACINKKGEQVFSLPDTYKDVHRFSEGRALVWDGTAYGFIDTTGKLVIPCEYTCYEGFSEGMVPVQKDGKSGYLDREGNSTFDYNQ